MTAPSKAALRAELEAALANYGGPVKQCPAAPPPEPELEALDDEDEADEEIVPGLFCSSQQLPVHLLRRSSQLHRPRWQVSSK
jgi:hypothetical protein